MRIYKSLEEYRQCVENYRKQIQPYVRHAHITEDSLFVVFFPGDMGQSWLKILAEDICLAIAYGKSERDNIYYDETSLSYAFFAGDENEIVWTRETRNKIRRWFLKRAPGVELWKE